MLVRVQRRRGAYRLVPFPAGSQGDRHRGLLRRLLAIARELGWEPGSRSRKGSSGRSRSTVSTGALLGRGRERPVPRPDAAVAGDPRRARRGDRRRARRRAVRLRRAGRRVRGGVRRRTAARRRRRRRVGNRRDHDRACSAVGVGAGDEVITAANTCVPPSPGSRRPARRRCSPTSTRDLHARPGGAGRRCVTERTRAIVPVHLYGQCADMDAVARLARATG